MLFTSPDPSARTWVLEPPPKPQRWLFLPTAVLGGLAAAGAGAGLVVHGVRGELGGGSIAMLGVGAFGALMLVAGLYVLTVRARYELAQDERQLRVVRRSIGRRRERLHSIAEFDRVELRHVRGGSSVRQVDVVGAYVMVWLVGPQASVHLVSDRTAGARELAAQLAELTGLAVSESR